MNAQLFVLISAMQCFSTRYNDGCFMLLLVFAACIISVDALALPSIYSSSMVIQHSTSKNILWGTAASTSDVGIVLPSGQKLSATANANGRWEVGLPSTPPTATPGTITITGDGTTISLVDVVFGEVYVCSGQSNMELSVIATLNATQEIAAAGSHGPNIRVMQVAMQSTYGNVSVPQANLSVSIPWGHPGSPADIKGHVGYSTAENGVVSVDITSMSGMCYYYGIELTQRHKDMPVGMIASSWGGTAIEVWMTPDALKSCGRTPDTVDSTPSYQTSGNHTVPEVDKPLIGMRVANGKQQGTLRFDRIQMVASVTWGESNSGQPESYAKCFPAMISQWRKSWGGAPNATFIFVQLAPWPDFDVGLITGTRYAQMAALDLPGVGMVVSADIGDPAGSFHPIHPPFKQEVARRAALVGEYYVHGNVSIPPRGPRVVSVTLDAWNPSWGNYHHGIEAGVCSNQNGWMCAGLRVTFDTDISVLNTPGGINGWRHGFELWNNISGNAATGGTSAGSRQLDSSLCLNCALCPCFQPLEFGGALDARTIQLNTTFVSGTPGVLKYAWHDYPTMTIYDAFGRPAEGFNVTVPFTLP